MDESNKNFHELALKSILFKGRADWYFCYLKSEKIAHVLSMLAQDSSFKDTQDFEELVTAASRLPHTMLHFIAEEVEAAVVLADIFSLLSMVRLSATKGYIRKENTLILVEEYETIARKVAAQNRPSPFVSSQDFAVEIEGSRQTLEVPAANVFTKSTESATQHTIKDKNKGHIKDNDARSKGQQNRTALILDFVKKNKGVSIKEIAHVVRGCSEKTIQRELSILITQGLVERRGERRWSVYLPTSSFS
ncbi:MAG TPA: hypothetical protein VHD31_00045 [Candidatus Paceibacterota bacterium]|nr:hypothetical protein [Candidatus Paceibacterota bacterium]